MAVIKKVPAIRFNGFNNEWSKDLLGELSDVYDGTHQTPIYTNSGVMFLSVENIQTLKSDKYISKEAFEKEFKTYPQSGDVLMTRIGDIGTANVVETNEPIAYYVSLALLKQKKLHPYFLKHSISTQTVVNDLWRRTLHIAFPKKINKNEIAKVEIPYPIENEQNQIGSYFQHLDRLISFHQAKVNKLNNLKKAMLEKMFPKQDANVPEIRFKGFAGAWEEKSLGDEVAEIVGGGTPNTFEPTYWNGDIDWYSPTEIGTKVFADGSVKKITQLGLQNSSAKLLPASKTILFTSRAGIGDMAILRRIGATNQGFQSMVLKDGYDPYFIYSMGYLIKDYAIKYSSGSTFLEISGKILGKMVIKVPSLTEQEKIGSYFQNLDKTISLHQTELEKLGNLKKACLEKMFV